MSVRYEEKRWVPRDGKAKSPSRPNGENASIYRPGPGSSGHGQINNSNHASVERKITRPPITNNSSPASTSHTAVPVKVAQQVDTIFLLLISNWPPISYSLLLHSLSRIFKYICYQWIKQRKAIFSRDNVSSLPCLSAENVNMVMQIWCKLSNLCCHVVWLARRWRCFGDIFEWLPCKIVQMLGIVRKHENTHVVNMSPIDC